MPQISCWISQRCRTMSQSSCSRIAVLTNKPISTALSDMTSLSTSGLYQTATKIFPDRLGMSCIYTRWCGAVQTALQMIGGHIQCFACNVWCVGTVVAHWIPNCNHNKFECRRGHQSYCVIPVGREFTCGCSRCSMSTLLFSFRYL